MHYNLIFCCALYFSYPRLSYDSFMLFCPSAQHKVEFGPKRSTLLPRAQNNKSLHKIEAIYHYKILKHLRTQKKNIYIRASLTVV